MKRHDLERRLRELGWRLLRHGGRHDVWTDGEREEALPHHVEIACDDTPVVIGLLLRRQRQKSGLSLAEAAQRLGAKSRNAYARYESGTSVPTVAKLDELLRAIAPDRDLVILQGAA